MRTLPRYRNRVAGCVILLAFALSLISFLHQVQDRSMSPSSWNELRDDHVARTGSGGFEQEEEDEEYQQHQYDKQDAGSNGLLLCQRLQGKSVPLLWQRGKTDLLQASLHAAADAHGYHTEWMSALLQQLSSSLLQKGLLNPPSAPDLHRIMRKIEARIMANYNNNATTATAAGTTTAAVVAPIVQVGVFGGSVTQGSGCNILPDELQPFFFRNKTEQEALPPKIGGTSCAWPTRLQLLCDYFFGKHVVQITNLGVGGTSSKLAKPVLKYRFFGTIEHLNRRGFDVIINGYGVNDNYFESSWNYKSRSRLELKNFYESLTVAQDFYRQARTSRQPSCTMNDDDDAPVIIYVNEYIGNQNEIILGENLRHAAVKLVAEYYDFMYVSYTHVIQRFVHRRSNETLFSPKWGTLEKPRVEAHFGMPGHVLLPWVISYAALQYAVDYCNQQQVALGEQERQEEAERGGQNKDQETTTTNSHHRIRLVPDTSKDTVLRNSLPPLLPNASWSTISETWQRDAAEYEQQVHDYCALGENVTANKPCSFAFLASPIGTTRTAGSLNKYLASYIAPSSSSKEKGGETTGWSGVDDMGNGWTNKVGVVPTKGVGSKIVFAISKLKSPVRLVTIHSMKSYGADWNSSIANFKLSVFEDSDDGEKKSLYETNFNLTGWHNQKTSIGYAHEFDFGFNTPAQVGKSFQLEVTLLQGIKFKIMAIMMCSR